jgi:hypothetical protein
MQCLSAVLPTVGRVYLKLIASLDLLHNVIPIILFFSSIVILNLLLQLN